MKNDIQDRLITVKKSFLSFERLFIHHLVRCHAAFSTIFHFIMIGRPNFQIVKVYPPANVNVRSAVSVFSISHWTTDPNFKIDSIYFCFWHILSSNRQQIRFIHSIAFRDHILSSIHPINLNYSFKY